MTMISVAFQNNLDLTRRGFLFRTGLSDLLILAFMHPTRLTDIVQKFEELSMVIRSVFADNNKMSLTRQIFFPPPFLLAAWVMLARNSIHAMIDYKLRKTKRVLAEHKAE